MPLFPPKAVAKPRCRHCGRYWTPKSGLAAFRDYCQQCSAQRREKAKRAFGLRPLSAEDVADGYLRPRRG